MRSLLASLRALLMLPLLAAATPAAAGEFVNTAALDTLFAELVKAPDAAAAEAITQTIWAYWTNPSEAEARGGHDARARGGNAQRLYRRARDARPHRGRLSGLCRGAGTGAPRSTSWCTATPIPSPISKRCWRSSPGISARCRVSVMIELTLGDRPAALKDMVAALAIHPYLGMKQYFPELNVPVTNI